MTDDRRVQLLLDELLDSHRTPEEVCRPWPELLPPVRAQWRQMCRIQAQLDALFPTDTEPSSGWPETAGGNAELPTIPGYEVQAVLGRGGMGIVYRARHSRLNRLVALKMTIGGEFASPHERERFQREAMAVAGLRHPNVVQIHDFGDSGGRPYLTMEFVEGGSLSQQLTGTPQPPRQAAELIATLAGAVQAAHESGVVHRDLKPANVLLTADGTPKISDFGLARRLDDRAGMTLTGTALGTPCYMAPEQAQGASSGLGPATDIYALGAILYELLTGRPPFRAATAAQTIQLVLSQNPTPPSRLNVKIPRDLETICLKCLHKEPERRYASAAALAEDLQRFLHGEAIAARPESRLERMARVVRRRPVVSAALAIGTFLSAALLSMGLWLVSEQAAAERAAAEDLRDMAQRLRQSEWNEARAAMERAKGRLGNHGRPELRRHLDQGSRELELAARLEAIRLETAQLVMGFANSLCHIHYEEAFRTGELGRVGDDPELVASRIRSSNIRETLLAALDHWSGCTYDRKCQGWVLNVARRADLDQTDWRQQARDSAVRQDEAALIKVMQSAPENDHSVPLLLALDRQLQLLNSFSKERLPFLKRVQRAHPTDFWANSQLAGVVSRESPTDAIRYYQAAISLRPQMASVHHQMGWMLICVGRQEEAVTSLRQAMKLDPTSVQTQHLIGIALTTLGRHNETIAHFQQVIRSNPNSAGLYWALGKSLDAMGRHTEALANYREAVALDPQQNIAKGDLRASLVRQGRPEEARIAWQRELDANPLSHDACYGYAEFCLFMDQKDEYRRARRALLDHFGAATLPQTAERTARACLLHPATGEELRQAVSLAQRAAAVEPSKYQNLYPLFAFARGLAEYRQGKLDQAIATMRGDASGVLGPAPRLVLAMALHSSGQVKEARQTFAAAVLAHDWRASQAVDVNGWVFHVLRREAEEMIIPRLPDLLEGKLQPRDREERIALLGALQSTNRPLALVRLYSDVFAAEPDLAADYVAGHRLASARAAVLSGFGRGEDATGLDDVERRSWRDQALLWLRADLSDWVSDGAPAGGDLALRTLMLWRVDPAFARVCDPAELERFSEDERRDWVVLWDDVGAAIKRGLIIP